MIFFLTIKSLRKRKLSAILCIFSIALSIALFLGVTRIKKQAENSFMSTVSGVDLLVGARSGDINLILYSLFHMGSPTNNLHYDTFQTIKKLREVKWTIPISLGDSYRGNRVIGTNENMFTHYKYGEKRPLEFAQGKSFNKLFEVVLGAAVAKNNGHKLGDKISLSHGSGATSLMDHENIKFQIVGILKSTKTPMDNAVLVSLEAIEAIHLGWETGVPDGTPEQDKIILEDLRPSAITSILLATKSKFQMLRLRQMLGTFQGEPLSAVIPGLALSRLWTLLEDVEKSLLIISLCVLLVGLISITVSLINTLQARRKEMAILRAIGARPRVIAGLYLVEGPLLTSFGIILGIFLLITINSTLSTWIGDSYQVQLSTKILASDELNYLLIFFAAGLISGIIPAIFAYRQSLHSSFSE